jgi:hypothetical protein
LNAEDIQPGSQPSYETCKVILAYHPLGLKMTESPISKAQSQERKLSVSDGPESALLSAFRDEWASLKVDEHIKNFGKLARAYGVSAIGLMVEGEGPETQLDFANVWKKKVGVNVWDPLNVSGSLVLSQDPNSPDFQRPTAVQAAGVTYHPSRTMILLNEEPIYLDYTTSGFGYVGRSVYQRALFPLKSYLTTMVANNQVALKASVLIAMIKTGATVVDQAQMFFQGLKRNIIKEAQNGNVISIGQDDKIESLNFQNLDGPLALARKNILDDVATASDMPAIILNQETFAEGLSDGTEDSKHVAQWVAGIRKWLRPAYSFFDQLVMARAWNPEWYANLQRTHKEWARVPYRTAFYRFKNSFRHEWPNLLEEPDSEKVQVDDVRLKGIIAVAEVLLAMPDLGQPNRARLVQWVMDGFNSLELMFGTQLELELEDIAEYEPPAPVEGAEGAEGAAAGAAKGNAAPAPAPPFSARDSVANFAEAAASLRGLYEKREESRARWRAEQKERVLGTR